MSGVSLQHRTSHQHDSELYAVRKQQHTPICTASCPLQPAAAAAAIGYLRFGSPLLHSLLTILAFNAVWLALVGYCSYMHLCSTQNAMKYTEIEQRKAFEALLIQLSPEPSTSSSFLKP